MYRELTRIPLLPPPSPPPLEVFVEYKDVKDKFDSTPSHYVRLAPSSFPPLCPPPATLLNSLVPNLDLKISQMGDKVYKLYMLNDYGQQVIKPMLDELVEKVGGDIARGIMIKF